MTLKSLFVPGWPGAAVRYTLVLGLTLSLVSCGKKETAEEGSDAGSDSTAAVTPDGGSNPDSGAPGTEPEGGSDPKMAGKGATADSGSKGTGPGTPAKTEATRSVPVMELADSPYATAAVLVQDLSAKLQGGDLKGFLEVVGPKAATNLNRMRLRSLLVDRSYQVNKEDPVKVTDQAEGLKLLHVNLLPGPSDQALGKQALELDLVQGTSTRWGVSEMRVPDILEIAAAKMGQQKPSAPPEDPGNPLGVAKQFLDAVVAKDFGVARRMVDTGKLSDEKLAALFIVVEEGSFKPHQNKPLISTMARNNNAWIIARLESSKQQSDFGIEMSRSEDAAPWKVVGLNFSKLIQKAAMQAGAGDIAYTPLRKDLKGGEQIVIYFEFDNTGVNPRAEKQLGIIAEILKQDSNRKLHINGHADSLGIEDYNKELSERRANSVKNFLASYGIPPQQIVTQGFGEAEPQAPNVNPDGTDNPSGRAQNRRAEVYLSF